MVTVIDFYHLSFHMAEYEPGKDVSVIDSSEYRILQRKSRRPIVWVSRCIMMVS